MIKELLLLLLPPPPPPGGIVSTVRETIKVFIGIQ